MELVLSPCEFHIFAGPISVSSLRLVIGTASLISHGSYILPSPSPFLSHIGALLGRISLASHETGVCNNAAKIWGARGRGAG